jgi:hypothetical protein
MWDNQKLSFGGSFSLRKIALIFLAVVMTSASFVATLSSRPTYADSATWGSGDSISYQGQNYGRLTSPPSGLPGLGPEYTNIYATQPKDGKVSIVALKTDFDPTKDVTDARTVTYDFDENRQLYSNPDPPQGAPLTISAKPADQQKDKTSCVVPNIGWIICGVSKFIAGGMDKIYDIIANFLSVKPVSSDTGGGLFQAWNIARGLANALFIVAFLIIIYSQLTQMGISNYEIKKMIPRLIVAAILVNISYYICGVAVDVSNILGDSIAKALSQIRHSLPSPLPDNVDYLNWQNMTEWIMSGGTIAAGFWAAKAAFFGSALTGGTMSSMAFLLFPILVSGALAVLVAVLVLAARQALITVLIVASPLAFVAYLLPNTEKWFGRWRELFTTMLLMFPMFSLLFGGAQLASFIIIQNADQVSVIIFAMFIQVAPLFLTPFLVRFSGNMLGKLANNAHSKRKGIRDRARGWSEERAKMQAAKGQAAAAQGRGTYMQRRAFKRGQDKRNREAWVKHGEAYAEAAWYNDERYSQHHTGMHAAETWKGAGEAIATRHFEELKASPEGRPLQTLSGVKRQEDARAKALQTADEARWQEAQTGQVASGHRYSQFATSAYDNYRQQRIADSNTTMAQAELSQKYAREISGSVELQDLAGGIGTHGATKVKANALQEVIEAGRKNVSAIETASPVKAGDLKGMRAEFDKAVFNNDVDALRAYAGMMGEAKDPGIRALRSALNDHHDRIKASVDLHETFTHYISNHGTINSSAKDIGDWSRDVDGGYRKLSEISGDVKTWKNMDAVQFSGQKASSQREALMAKDNDGNWAISRRTAVELMKSPMAWGNIKVEMKPLIRARAEGRLAFSPRDGKERMVGFNERDDFVNPPGQRIDDSMVPPE